MSLKYKTKDGTTHNITEVTSNISNEFNPNSENAMSGVAINQWLPFKLGIDEEGNYGYIKEGSNEVTPFKSSDDNWVRPEEWPNLDLLPTDEQVIYLTIDNTDRNAMFGYKIQTTEKHILFEVGQLVNGVFETIKDHTATTSTNYSWLPNFGYFSDIDVDYPIVRITSTSNILAAMILDLKAPGGSGSSKFLNSILEAYYCLPSLKGNGYYASYSTQHVKLINCTSLTSLAHAFQDSVNLRFIEFENCDTSQVTTMAYFCFGCHALQNTDFLSSLDCQNCTDISQMFYSCQSLINLDLSKLKNTNKITTIEKLVAYSYSLTSISMKNMDLSSLTNTSSFISSSGGFIQELDLSEYDFANIATPGFLQSTGYRVKRFLPPANFNSNIYLGYVRTRKEALDVINNLKPSTGDYTVSIGTNALKSLTDEEKLIATNLGWTLA